MNDLQLDAVIPPDVQALIDDLAEEGRTAFERECDDCGVRFVPKQTWGASAPRGVGCEAGGRLSGRATLALAPKPPDLREEGCTSSRDSVEVPCSNSSTTAAARPEGSYAPSSLGCSADGLAARARGR